jgi:hypothetical protein
LEPSGNWLIDNLVNALNTWNQKLAEIWQLLTQTPEDFKGGGIWHVIVNINGALQAVGLALLVLFFAAGVVKSTGNLSEMKRPEAALKLFIRFAISKAVVTYGMDLMLTLFRICQGIISTVSQSVGNIGQQAVVLPDLIRNKITQVSFLDSIPLWIVTLIGSLFITILAFVMIMTVYGRFFRLYMYTAIAPIPLSTFAGDATSSVGKAFLKSYAAVCLEGAIIVLACVIFSVFASAPPAAIDPNLPAVQMVWNYVGELIFNMLVLVGAVKMSERIVKEMLGL